MARVTQAELARRLGLSQQAVSFALAESEQVSAETRDRVLAEAERLGYRRNVSALSMLSGRMGNAALLSVEEFKTFMPQDIISGANRALEDMGHHLVVYSLLKENLDKEDYVPGIMRELAVDGFLVMYEGEGENRLRKWLSQFKIPSIWLNRKEKQNCAYPNDFKLAYEATRKLIELGHKRIWMLGHSPKENSHYSIADRRAGYSSALEEEGLRPRFEESKELERNTRWLTGRGAPTACFCYGMEDGENAYVSACRAGIEVPRQLSLVVLGSALAHIGSRRFCNLRIPFYQVATEAVRLLEKRVVTNGASVSSHVENHIQFDEGETAAPPPLKTP